MTQEKMRKIITASVVAAVLLLVILSSVLIYQFIRIGVLNKRLSNLREGNAQLQEIIDEKQMDAEYYESVIGKEWLAIQEGFVRP